VPPKGAAHSDNACAASQQQQQQQQQQHGDALKRGDSLRTKRKQVTWHHQSSEALQTLTSGMAAAKLAGTSGGTRDTEALSQDAEVDVPYRTIDSLAAQFHQRPLATPHKSPHRRPPQQQVTPAINTGSSSGGAAFTGGTPASAGGSAAQRLSFGGLDDPEISVLSPYKPPTRSSAIDEPSAKRRPQSVIVRKQTKFASTTNLTSSSSANRVSSSSSSVLTQRVEIDGGEDGGEDDDATVVEDEEREQTANESERLAVAEFVRCEPTDQLHQLRLPSQFEKAMNTLTPETVAELLEGRYAHHYDRVLILDCRFQYEFDGGHVRGAIHVPTEQALVELMQRAPPTSSGERVCVVFHCEFSSQRGPALYRALRSWDRHVHTDCYPQLYYPELYLLKGGYKDFFNAVPHHCEPQAYQPMWDSTFKCEMGDGLRTNKVNRRSKSMNSVSEYRMLRRSLKW
jgi:hypothetical protein